VTDKAYLSLGHLAQRLLALETAGLTATEAPSQAAERVLEKLRAALSRFAGPEGFHALLRRALALARADVPELKNVQIGADGRLEGLAALFANADGPGPAAALAITTYLLALLTTFIGEPLMLRIVREAWLEGPWTTNDKGEAMP